VEIEFPLTPYLSPKQEIVTQFPKKGGTLLPLPSGERIEVRGVAIT